MAPRHLRASLRIDAPEMARRLGIAVADLITLESRSFWFWELDDLRRYIEALGRRLRVVAFDSRGVETELN
jgi:hypothetical protein